MDNRFLSIYKNILQKDLGLNPFNGLRLDQNSQIDDKYMVLINLAIKKYTHIFCDFDKDKLIIVDKLIKSELSCLSETNKSAILTDIIENSSELCGLYQNDGLVKSVKEETILRILTQNIDTIVCKCCNNDNIFNSDMSSQEERYSLSSDITAYSIFLNCKELRDLPELIAVIAIAAAAVSMECQKKTNIDNVLYYIEKLDIYIVTIVLILISKGLDLKNIIEFCDGENINSCTIINIHKYCMDAFWTAMSICMDDKIKEIVLDTFIEHSSDVNSDCSFSDNLMELSDYSDI